MKPSFGRGGILILGFFLQKIHFSLEKQCKYMHTHTQFKLQRTSVTLKKFNHLSFQINGVFDFSADTIRVKLRLNTNLSYHIAYQESLAPRRCIYICPRVHLFFLNIYRGLYTFMGYGTLVSKTIMNPFILEPSKKNYQVSQYVGPQYFVSQSLVSQYSKNLYESLYF